MEVIDPNVSIVNIKNPLERIEYCGRVCYNSLHKMSEGTALQFVNNLVARGHGSPLEHTRIVIPVHLADRLISSCKKKPQGILDRLGGDAFDITINARDFLAVGGYVSELEDAQLADDFMTVEFTCDRAIANELVRHRVASFCQTSTRYVKYKNGIRVVRPLPFDWAVDTHSMVYEKWYDSCIVSEDAYLSLLEEGLSPQEARNVLPLSTATTLIMTATHKQWEDIIKLRTDSGAHPQVSLLMKMLLNLPKFPQQIKIK